MDEFVCALDGAPYAPIMREIAEEFPGAIPKLLQLVQYVRGDASTRLEPVQIGDGKVVAPPASSFSGFFTLKQASFLTPRGKFDLAFGETGLKLMGKDVAYEVCVCVRWFGCLAMKSKRLLRVNVSYQIPRDNVKHVFNIPTSDRTEAKVISRTSPRCWFEKTKSFRHCVAVGL
jgi:hypothetical protein